MSGNYASIGFRSFIISFLCIVGVACVVAGITYSMELWGGKVLPDVVGMSEKDAEQTLLVAGFESETEKVSSDEEKGTVVRTNPEAGVRLDTNVAVILYIAQPKTVPSVYGLTLDEAKSLLNENGYDNIEVVEKASDKKEGTVLEQEPKSNAKAKSDAKITLTVATPHLVPSVVGMSETEAKSAIANAGYKYFVTVTYSDDVPAGDVLETQPKAGEALESSGTVEIKVAKSRSSELIEIAKKYLSSLSKISVNNRSFEVSEIDSVEYENNSSCKFVLTARPYEMHSWFGSEPETRYGNYEKIEGTIEINDKNEVVSTNPAITTIQ